MERSVRVLYVDADPAPSTVDRLEAAGEGVEVTAVADRASALARLEDDTVDCVVVGLDPARAVELLSAVRERRPACPCILYADADAAETVEAAYAAGATDVVRRSGPGQRAVLARRVLDHAGTGDGPDSERLRRLRERNELLEELFDQVPIHLYVKDTEGRFLWVSNFYEGAPSDAVGKTDLELFPEVGAKTHRDDISVIETGEPLLDEEEYVPLTDHHNLTSKVPWHGEDGEIKGLIGVTREISERKEYERRLERQNERLAEFAGIVSHDLRNPLQVAQGNLEVARDEYDDDHLEIAVDALDRMEEIIEDTLELARQGEAVGDRERVDLEAAVDRCWRAIESDGATVELADAPVVSADRSRTRALLENLLANAVEHGGEGVAVTVGGLPDGFYVADDGPGIPEDERDRVFEPSYTTVAGGTGFGLAIVDEVAEAHGWEVGVTDSDDGGARFEVTGVDVLEPVQSA